MSTPWWLCPNEPRCPHGAVLHDVYELEDAPRCCVEGCDCGRGEGKGARGGSYDVWGLDFGVEGGKA